MSLSVQSLCKRFSREADVLHNVVIEVADGEMVAITGPSGSGKSTLLHCIAGLLQVDSGEILIDGCRVNEKATHLRGIGIVMQDQPLYEHLSVAANIGFPLRSRGEKRPAVATRVQETMDALELESIANRKVSKLSGGERRRVALGRAIILRPRVLLLDEPLVSLDPELRASLQKLIRKVHDSSGDFGGFEGSGASTLIVTHDHDEASILGDRVVAMSALQFV